MNQYFGKREPFAASISGAPATTVIVILNIGLFIGVLVTGGADTQNLLKWGAKYGPSIADGQYWRLLVPVFLHAGFFHLLTNLFGLVIFGSMVERTFGTKNFIAIYLAAGIMGNVVSFLAGPNPGVGASGGVFGIVAAFGVYLLLNRKLLGQMGSQQLTSIGLIVSINIVFGLVSTGIDNAAHFGGLLAGGFVAWLTTPRERLFVLQDPVDLGQSRVTIKTDVKSTSKLTLAILVIVIIAGVLTQIGTQTYIEDIFGNKIPR